MIAALLSLAVAGVFVAVGVWGTRNAPDLVPASLSAHGRQKRVRALRRGALSCHAVGALLAITGLLAAIARLSGE